VPGRRDRDAGPGPDQGLITIAGNPVLSAPDAAKLDAALPALECMISVDNWLNETTRHAHVILPGSSVLEQPHYDEMIWSWAVRNAGKYCEAVFETEPGRPAEWQILLTLAAILQGQKAADVNVAAIDQLFFAGSPRRSPRIRARRSPAAIPARSSRRPVRLAPSGCSTSRSAPVPGATHTARNQTGSRWRSSRRSPTASTWGPLEPRLPGLLKTKSGKIELAPPYITGDIPRLRARLARRDEGLVLVSRRHVRSNNSWMHNAPSLVTGKDRCTLLVHPDDARAAGSRTESART
jgi:anaerobic selenocysteine-containing dehydrogenase